MTMNHLKLIYTQDNRPYWNRTWTLVKRSFVGPKETILLMKDKLRLPEETDKGTVFLIKSDLFHEDVPFEFQTQAFMAMTYRWRQKFILLTKHSDRLASFIQAFINHLIIFEDETTPFDELFAHVWFGIVVEDQARFDERWESLKKLPKGCNIIISYVPALGPLVLPQDFPRNNSWIICVAENGPEARPMDLQWARDLREQCRTMGIPFWMGSPGNGQELPGDLDIRETPLRPW